MREEIARSHQEKSVFNLGPTYAWEDSADFNAVYLTLGEVNVDLSHHFTPKEIEYFNKGR
ncbi:hypothetical protein NSQ29_01335 [Paenibacillus sp. FSL F4-0236]|uniref:hypothetical protein n=1 Tax=Paenibacillus sp. FSL F4-0236 TaxID=2954731 RepID=UPI0030F74060